MNCTIDILLPVYNGEKYLAAQLDSLLMQSYADWSLIIRDDLSTDNTLALVQDYVSKYPDRICVLGNQTLKKGVVGSYDSLLHASTARYIAFCDQDDVWRPDKLSLQMKKMKELESMHGESSPILVHTDLSVVDDGLCMISSSFWKFQHLKPDTMSKLPRLLVQNCVTGCTALINRPLIERALPIPKGAIMHDWWIALVAISEGIVCDMKETTVNYRQHDNNDTGARQWGLGYIINALIYGREMQLHSLLKTRVQAEALISANVLNDVSRRIVEKYIALYNTNWFMRRIEMFRMGFFKYGIVRNIAMFLRL
jgi:glycosyltransferase involved in cell wall biosynthesis